MSQIESRKTRRAPQKPRKRTRSPWRALILIGAFFLMLFVGFKLADAAFAPVTAKPIIPDDEEPAISEARDHINILIIGTDEREGESPRSDTLILASLFTETKEVKLLSIPRDSRVSIPGRKNLERINHAYAYGGPDLSVQTVENFLGLTVDSYIKTNFQGFVNIIDILGGITYNVEKRMYYPEEGIDLDPGLQKLGGKDALAYVRYRSDGLGDIGRVDRQQKFLSALLDNVTSISTVWKIPDLVKEISRNVNTDLSAREIISLATKFATIKGNNVETTKIPGEGETIGGVSYWIVDTKGMRNILENWSLVR